MSVVRESPARRPSDPVVGALSEAIFSISRLFYAYVARLEAVLEELGLAEHVRPGMGHVLFALFEEDDVIIKNLVERTRLAPSSLGRLLVQMHRAKLVDRRPCDDDGRAVRVRLTSLGRSLEKRCRRALAKLKRIVESDFEPEELSITRNGIERMIKNLR